MPTESYRQGCSSRGHCSRNRTQDQHEAGVTTKDSNLGTSWASSASTANGSDTTGEIVPNHDASHRVVPMLCVDRVAQPYTPHCTTEVNGVQATGVCDTGASIISTAARLIREEDRKGGRP